MKIIYNSVFPARLESFVRLAMCLGIEAQRAEVGSEAELDIALSRSSAAGNALMIDITSIAAGFPAGAGRLHSALASSKALVLLLVADETAATSRFLELVTAGSISAVHRTDAVEARFSRQSKDLTRELSGHTFRRSDKPALHFATQDEAFDQLLSIGGNPSFGRLEGEDASKNVFVWGTPAVFDMLRPLDAELEFELAVDEYLPAVIFLRSAFADRCWHNPSTDAALVIDDPLLERRYGFIDFEKLLASAREHQYHVTLGFIPWNYRRTRSANADFFRSREDVFSLCVHGNDHTEGEFGSDDYHDLLGKAFEALSRMDLHRARTGLQHEVLMVCPQERYSVEALRALSDSQGFSAVVNTRRIPDDPAAHGKVCGADLLLPAQDSWFGIPLLKRHYASEGMSRFALALFLGRPAVLAEHHQYFQGGTARIERFVADLSTLDPAVKWRPLTETIRRLRWQRRLSGQRWCMRFFSDVFELVHQSDESGEYELIRRIPENEIIETVTVDGQPIAFAFEGNMLHLEVFAPARAVRRIEVHRRAVRTPKARVTSPSYRAQVALRRALSELRDNVLARNDAAHRVARALIKGLRQTAR